MGFDEKFLPERFTDPNLSREWILADRKREIYAIREDRKKLADFIVDIIALANMSYRHGEVARLLFGINNDRTLVTYDDGTPRGVKGQSTKNSYLQDVDYNDPNKVDQLFQYILNDFRSAVHQYIKPSGAKGDLKMELDIKTGWIDGYLLAYLEIMAQTANPDPYSVNREIRYTDSKRKPFIPFPGDAWYREHEHNEKMTPELFRVWYSVNDCPVITGAKWKAYFEDLSSGEFRKAQDLPGYQEPKDIDGIFLYDRVQEFLKSPNTLLIIEGAAGMGKTFFLRRLVFEIAKDAIAYTQDLPTYVPPQYWLPVYNELRNSRFGKDADLAHKALTWWNEKMKFPGLSQRATKLFHRPDARWILFLDALDEMNNGSVRNFVVALEEFRLQFSNIKIIVTTRPDSVDPAWRNSKFVVRMREFDDDNLYSFLQKVIAGEDSEDDLSIAIKTLEENPELLKLTRTPLYLSSFAKVFSKEPVQAGESLLELQNESPPESSAERVQSSEGGLHPSELLQTVPDLEYTETQPRENPSEEHASLSARREISTDDNQQDEEGYSLSRVLENMIKIVWQHDSKHFQKPKNQVSLVRPLVNLRRLAAEIDGENHCELISGEERVGGQRILGRFLSLGFLELQNSWIQFRSEMLQCYLAAQYLNHIWHPTPKARQKIQRLISPTSPFWNFTLGFYKEIAYDPESIHFVSSLIENQTDS